MSRESRQSVSSENLTPLDYAVPPLMLIVMYSLLMKFDVNDPNANAVEKLIDMNINIIWLSSLPVILYLFHLGKSIVSSVKEVQNATSSHNGSKN